MRAARAQELAQLLSAEVSTWTVKEEVLSSLYQQGCLQTSLHPKKSWSEVEAWPQSSSLFSDVIGWHSEQTDATILPSRKHAKQLSF